MAASKIIVSENIEVPVVDGKIQCIRCKGWKLPGEMHFKDRTCQTCYETIRARNRDKPKPKNHNSKIIKKNAMGWVERVEKTTRAIEDLELAKMIILERAADHDVLPSSGPTTSEGSGVSETACNTNDRANRLPEELSDCIDGFRVSETNNHPSDMGIGKPESKDGFRVSETNDRPTNNDSPKTMTDGGFMVSETTCKTNDHANRLPEELSDCIDGFRVSETNDRPTNNDSPKTMTEGGFMVSETTCKTNGRANRLPEELSDCIDGSRVSETNNHPSDMGIGKPESKDGFRVSETNDRPTNNDSPKTMTDGGFMVSETTCKTNGRANRLPEELSDCIDGSRVSETNNHPSDMGIGKPESKDGFRVSETNDRPTNNDSPKPIAKRSFTVSDLQKQIADLEKHCGEQAEMLAKALRRIAALEAKTAPAIEKDDAKRDSDGMEKLRNDLYGILKEQYEKRKINGIYVKSLYGPNGRNGGVLGVSKATAWRLREACRLDKRFRVEKADNQRGNWTIRLNLYMN